MAALTALADGDASEAVFTAIGDDWDIEERSTAQLARLGRKGRKGAPDTFDAAGFLVENTAEMEIIADPHFQPRIVDPGENLSNYRVVNRWGQLPSEAWLAHYNPCAA